MKSKKQNWIECGVIATAHGVKGELRVVWNNHETPVKKGEMVYLKEGDAFHPYELISSHPQQQVHIVKFQPISDRTQAEQLRGKKLYVSEEMLPSLSSGEYYTYQLLGLRVVTEQGKEIGSVTHVFSTGANDIYEVMPEGGKKGEEVLIPAIHQVIVAINLDEKKIIIRELEGLL